MSPCSMGGRGRDFLPCLEGRGLRLTKVGEAGQSEDDDDRCLGGSMSRGSEGDDDLCPEGSLSRDTDSCLVVTLSADSTVVFGTGRELTGVVLGRGLLLFLCRLFV